eukprot:9487774-Pyramimonas_sp.AAC.1
MRPIVCDDPGRGGTSGEPPSSLESCLPSHSSRWLSCKRLPSINSLSALSDQVRGLATTCKPGSSSLHLRTSLVHMGTISRSSRDMWYKFNLGFALQRTLRFGMRFLLLSNIHSKHSLVTRITNLSHYQVHSPVRGGRQCNASLSPNTWEIASRLPHRSVTFPSRFRHVSSHVSVTFPSHPSRFLEEKDACVCTAVLVRDTATALVLDTAARLPASHAQQWKPGKVRTCCGVEPNVTKRNQNGTKTEPNVTKRNQT